MGSGRGSQTPGGAAIDAAAQDRALIQAALGRLRRRLRLARAVVAGARFLLPGAALACGALLLKGLWPAAPLAAAGLLAGSAALGIAYGALAPLPASRVAALADRRLGLKERLTAAAEHLRLDSPDDLALAQLAETARRIRGLDLRRTFPLTPPAETRLLLPGGALLLALALLPALSIPLPSGGPDAPPPAAEPAPEPAPEPALQPKLPTTALPTELFPRGAEREVQRGPLGAHDQPGELAAAFRDSKLGERRPDFNSFIRQGDDRLKLLARPESLPDLSRDFTQNPYQLLLRRMQADLQSGRLQGLSWEQIERLLSELGPDGRRGDGGALADELAEGLRQPAPGGADKMLSALSRALNRLRDRSEAGQGSGRPLRQAPAAGQPGSGAGKGEPSGQEGASPGGSQAGTGASPETRGSPTDRLPGERQDANLEGDPRQGPTPSYDTNLSGPGAANASRLPYLEVLTRYQRMMEEALAREPIPRSYREQVKEYFQSLERR